MPAIAAEEAERNRKSGTETGASHNAAAPERNMSLRPHGMLCQQKEKPVQAKNKSAGYKTIRQTAVKNIVPQPCRRKENAPIIRNIPRLPILPGRRKQKKRQRNERAPKEKTPKRQERNSINQVEKKISLQKRFLFSSFTANRSFPLIRFHMSSRALLQSPVSSHHSTSSIGNINRLFKPPALP